MKRYVIVIIIFLVLLVGAIIISWQVFPAWQNPESGGFWTLLAVAAVAVVGFVGKLVSLWKDLKDDKKEKESPPPPLQRIEKQEAEHSYNAPGGGCKSLARGIGVERFKVAG